MSDVHRPTDDELVSAYLDGEATPEERALVEGDPRLLGEVDQLRRISSLTAAVPAPSDENREADIAAALAVYDANPAGKPASVTGSGTVVDLGAKRRQRAGRWYVALSAAAAVVLVVVVGAVLVTRGRSSQTSETMTAAAPKSTQAPAAGAQGPARAAEPSSKAAESDRPSADAATAAPTTTMVAPNAAATSQGATGGAPVPAAVVDAGDLGPLTAANFSDVLATQLAQLTAGRTSGAPQQSGDAATVKTLAACMTTLRGSTPGLGTVALSATGTVDGQDVVILVFRNEPPASGYRAFAVLPDCRVVLSGTL